MKKLLGVLFIFWTVFLFGAPSYPKPSYYEHAQDMWDAGEFNDPPPQPQTETNIPRSPRSNPNSRYPQDQFMKDSDRDLNNQIRSYLGNRQYENIRLRTAKGIVYIDGFVSNPNDLMQLNIAISQVDGIQAVLNQALVKNI